MIRAAFVMCGHILKIFLNCKCYTIHFERCSVVLYEQTFLRDISLLLL